MFVSVDRWLCNAEVHFFVDKHMILSMHISRRKHNEMSEHAYAWPVLVKKSKSVSLTSVVTPNDSCLPVMFHLIGCQYDANVDGCTSVA